MNHLDFSNLENQIKANGGVQIKRYTKNGKMSYEVNGQKYERLEEIPEEYRDMFQNLNSVKAQETSQKNTHNLFLGFLLGILIFGLGVGIFLYLNGNLKINL